ncbi:MAG: glycosyltransferase family 39 protein, partial [Bacteroidota bacterium]
MNRSIGFLVLAGAVFFLPFLGAVHLFDWDEINFAEISREMIELNDYLRIHVNYEPFWEKPPFFFWLQALAMHIFGVGEYAARLPNALFGILTLVVLYRMGKQVHSKQFGWLWAIVYLGTILPHLYFRSGIIDPIFNFFIFLGLYLFIHFVWKREKRAEPSMKYSAWAYLFWAGFSVGMAILTKGPVAFLVVCLCFGVYWIGERFRMYVNIPQFLFFTLAASLVTLSWYGLETLRHGPWFIKTFNDYQIRLLTTPDAGHKGFPGYHFAVLLVGCFPASIFAIRQLGWAPRPEKEHQADFRRWMRILFWVVLILFTVVRSKIVHYSSICYFPLTYLATLTLVEIKAGRIAFKPWMRAMLIAVGGLFVLASIAMPWVGQNIDLLKPLFEQDPFAMGNLEADVNWHTWDMIPGIWLLLVIFFGLRWLKQREFDWAYHTLFLGTAFFVTLALGFYISRIEAY